MIASAGSIEAGAVSGGKNIALQATDGDLVLHGDIATSSGIVQLTAAGAGSIFSSGALVNAPSIILSAGAGGVAGAQATGGGLAVSNFGRVVNVTAMSDGSVSLFQPNQSGGVQLSGNNTAGGAEGFTINSLGSITFMPGASITSATSATLISAGRMTAGAITTNAPLLSDTGNVSLIVTGAGPLTIAGNILANGGSILIQHQNAAAGSIVVSPGVSVETMVGAETELTNGGVTIVIGEIPSVPVVGTAPAKLNVLNSGGGQVYFGENPAGIIVTGTGTATVDAKGRDVIFNTPSVGLKISLGQGSLTKADPPLPGEAIPPQRPSELPNDSTQVRTSASVPAGAVAADALAHRSEVSGPGDLSVARLITPTTNARLSAGPVVFDVNGAMVVALQTGSSMAVFNLHDKKFGAASFVLCGKSFTIAPGQAIVVSDEDCDFERANPAEIVTYRGVRRIAAADGHVIYSAEFSIPSLVLNAPAVRSLFGSKLTSDVQLARSIAKTAAILHSTRARYGAYKKCVSPGSRGQL